MKIALPHQHTTDPVVTGSSVIALSFKDGVVMATDTMCSYYSMCQFKSVQRIEQLSHNTMIASTGEFSDFQEVVRILGEKSKEQFLNDDGIVMTPRDYANYLARLSYQKRNKINPLYLNNVIAGFHNGQRYLGYIDMYGTYIELKHVCTGFAGYFSKSLISNYWKEDCSEEEAKQMLIECFKVLYYRDKQAYDRIQIAVVDAGGVRIEKPIQLETKWNFREFVEKSNEKLHTQ